MTEIENEFLRKDKLSDLFSELEIENRKLKKKIRETRCFKDTVEVIKKRTGSLVVCRTNGEKIKPLLVPNEIAELIKVGDLLDLYAELWHNQWHIMYVESIGSVLGDSENEEDSDENI